MLQKLEKIKLNKRETRRCIIYTDRNERKDIVSNYIRSTFLLTFRSFSTACTVAFTLLFIIYFIIIRRRELFFCFFFLTHHHHHSYYFHHLIFKIDKQDFIHITLKYIYIYIYNIFTTFF